MLKLDLKNEELKKEIQALKVKQKAVILAHNYQRDEVQEIADFTGDSLSLAKTAVNVKAEVIVFCGVRFMAETAYILNPNKLVLMPEPRAGCPLADMITVEELRQLKADNPRVPVVCYVNSSAEIKAESDVCCTSANAVAIIKNIPQKKLIFIPDANLARYAASQTSKDIIIWPGYCPTHQKIKPEQILSLKEKYPQAVFLAHPECQASVLALADFVGSTSEIYKQAKKTQAKVVIVGSELGMLYRLQKESPEKLFLFPSKETICPNMKATNLKKVHRSLVELKTPVTVPEETRQLAAAAVKRMVEFSA